jgi:signal transduction histidine kinase
MELIPAEHFAYILGKTPIGVAILDCNDFRIRYINPYLQALLNETWQDREVIGHCLHEIVPAKLHQMVLPLLQQIVRTRQRAHYAEVPYEGYLASRGRTYWRISIECSPDEAEPREQLSASTLCIILEDVTEMVRARLYLNTIHHISAVTASPTFLPQVFDCTLQALQENGALQQVKAAQESNSTRMALLLEHLPSGIILVSAQDNAITVINQHAVRLLQRIGAPCEPQDNSEEAARRCIGTNCETLFRAINLYGTSGSLVPYEEGSIYRALSKGEASEAELHTPTVDGQLLHLLVNAGPLLAPDSTITSAVVVLHEITRVKALERAREDFFTTMAHELKTPLANIRAHLSALLARDLQWSLEEQYDFLQTADEQVERLVGMVNHFLDASRVEAGALRLELEPILLPEMFEDLQDRLEALISSSNRHLKITFAPQLPAVVGDYELIMRVLTNLLSNAFRYAPEGDIVHLAAYAESSDRLPDTVTISVTDWGPGMTTEQQMQVFTRFSTFAAMSRPAVDRPGQPAAERQRGTARWSPATGLGLYISRGIIEAHGNKLTLQSNPGKGATFSFTLPTYVGKVQQEKRNARV